MQTTSALYKSIFADPAHIVEWKITVNGTDYAGQRIAPGGSPKISRRLLNGNEPAVGACIAATLTCSIIEASSAVPRMAAVVVSYRLAIPLPENAGENAQQTVSEWHTLGTFYIDTRQVDKANGALILSCYDKMLVATGAGGATYAELTGFDEWPQTQAAVVSEIASIMGVTVDSRTSIGSGTGFVVDYPNDLSMLEVLGNIGAANAGNWAITPANELRLVPLTGGSDSFSLGTAAMGLKTAPALAAWSGVSVYYDDEAAYEAGDDTGRVLTCDCIWATQETASAILTALSGSAYQPYTADGAIIDMALELGDIVTVGAGTDTVSGPVFVIDITGGGMEQASISAPGDAEIDHEYPYASYVDRSLRRKVGLNTPYYGVTISRQNGLEIKRSDGASEAIFNSDRFEMDALIDGTMQPRIYFDPIRGDYVFNGALGADAIFTDSLYAELGFVAELTVDRLTTSRRVRKYLLQDTSDDNHIQIQDHYQKFITGSVISADVLDTEAGQHLLTQNSLYMTVEPPNDSYLVVQVTNRYGQRLYWQREIVSVTADGYPLDENNRQIYATTETTDWPVLSYAYAEQVKAEYAFAQDGQYYVPQIVLGAGDGHGNSRGYIYKRQTDLLMRYVTTNGKNVDIQFSDEGYVDALHRRLSYLHIMRDQYGTGGTIYYKVEGNNTMHTLEFVEIDGLLRYTWPDGHVCEVSVE